MFNPDFFIRNRQKLIEQLPENSIVFVTSADELPRNGDQTFSYRQSSDLFYLTGINQEQTILMINNSHPVDANREILFIRQSNETIETWEGRKLTPKQAFEISGIDNIHYTEDFDSLLGDLMFYADNVFVNVNNNVRYLRFYNDADFRLIEKLRTLFPLHNYQRLTPYIVKQRLVKQEEEIEVIKKAIKITKDAFLRVLKFVKPGVGEFEVMAEITHEFIRQKAFNHAYSPIVASGENNNILHYTENDKYCQNGDLLLLDFGSEYMNYAADISRTIPVNGEFTKEQIDVYNAVLTVQKEARNLMKPGMTIRRWNIEVGEIMQEELLKLRLIDTLDIRKSTKNNPAYKKYFLHGAGHFLGLDVHDVGTIDTPWKPGMIITNEPGIYIKEKGFGIRLENDILITENGSVDLAENIPITPDDIMTIMKS